MPRPRQTKLTRTSRQGVKKATHSRLTADVAVQLSTLHHQQEYTAKEFANLAEKFDKIFERLEQLTLSSTTLISRHDTQIQTMQRQLHDTTETITTIRDRLESNIASLVSTQEKQLADAVSAMSQSIDRLTTTVTTLNTTTEQRIAGLSVEIDQRAKATDERISKLERWRWILIGAGSAIGYVISQFITPFLEAFVKR